MLITEMLLIINFILNTLRTNRTMRIMSQRKFHPLRRIIDCLIRWRSRSFYWPVIIWQIWWWNSSMIILWICWCVGTWLGSCKSQNFKKRFKILIKTYNSPGFPWFWIYCYLNPSFSALRFENFHVLSRTDKNFC